MIIEETNILETIRKLFFNIFLPSFLFFSAKSSSPSTRRKGLVKDEFYTKDQDVEEGSSSRIGVNDFDFIRVIGRGSYAKVMMVCSQIFNDIFHFFNHTIFTSFFL